MTTVTRENWADKVRASGLTMKELGVRTGVSEASVQSYAMGRRRPPDSWVSRCGEVLYAYAWEWTCPVCLIRNPAERQSCRQCARSYDSYDPSIVVRPWGSAQ